MKPFYKTKSFIILLIIAILLSFLPFIFKSISFSDIIGPIFAPAQKLSYKLTNQISSFINHFSEYDELKEENNLLKAENERLQSELQKAQENQQEYDELIKYLNIKEISVDSSLLEASIISQGANSYDSIFTIDKGTSCGVNIGMCVITNEGIIGQIISVSKSTSIVAKITNASYYVSAYVKETKDVGLIQGDYPSSNTCKLKYLPIDSNIKMGDTVFSNGDGDIFPKNLSIGVVSDVSVDNFTQTKTATITPSATINNKTSVIVVLSYSEVISEEN